MVVIEPAMAMQRGTASVTRLCMRQALRTSVSSACCLLAHRPAQPEVAAARPGPTSATTTTHGTAAPTCVAPGTVAPETVAPAPAEPASAVLRLGMRCELRRLQQFLLDVLNLVRELRLLRLLLALRVVLLFGEALDRHARRIACLLHRW